MAIFRGQNMHDQNIEHYLILRVPQGDKSVMNSSSDNRETGNPSYRTAVVARQILWLMPLPHCRWRDTVWPNLQKGMKNIALSGKTNKISKNHHLIGNWLLCPYVWFEVATVSCWSYRKRILDFCTYTNTIVFLTGNSYSQAPSESMDCS